jgi:hypothetical protein
VPDTFKRTIGTIGVGTMKTGTSDSCMWTIVGNQTDYSTGLSLQVNKMVALNVSVFNGRTFESARIISPNIDALYKLNINLLNNTYIVASPYSDTLKTATFNLTYYTIKNMYNLTYMDTFGYVYTVKAEILSSDTSTMLYYALGLGFGCFIVVTLICFFGCQQLLPVMI